MQNLYFLRQELTSFWVVERASCWEAMYHTTVTIDDNWIIHYGVQRKHCNSSNQPIEVHYLLTSHKIRAKIVRITRLHYGTWFQGARAVLLWSSWVKQSHRVSNTLIPKRAPKYCRQNSHVTVKIAGNVLPKPWHSSNIRCVGKMTKH